MWVAKAFIKYFKCINVKFIQFNSISIKFKDLNSKDSSQDIIRVFDVYDLKLFTVDSS